MWLASVGRDARDHEGLRVKRNQVTGKVKIEPRPERGHRLDTYVSMRSTNGVLMGVDGCLDVDASCCLHAYTQGIFPHLTGNGESTLAIGQHAAAEGLGHQIEALATRVRGQRSESLGCMSGRQLGIRSMSWYVVGQLMSIA